MKIISDVTRFFNLCARRIFHGFDDAPFILMYHRVLDPDSSFYPIQPGMYVTPKTFEMHLEILNKKYNVLPLRELLEEFFVKKNKIKRCCAITFDDGWIDNYTFAFPLIVKYKIPATIFLATRYVGQDLWFWEEIVALFVHSKSMIEVNDFFRSNLVSHQYKKISKNVGDLTKIIAAMKQLPVIDCERLVRKIEDKYFFGKNLYRIIMNWDEIKIMQHCAVDFFSHSHSHLVLTCRENSEVELDIKTSIEILRKEIGTVQDIFCYPSGRFGDKIIDILKEEGVKYAVTTSRSAIGPLNNVFSVPRIGIHDDISRTPLLFKSNLP